jgi:hypothetical protein
MNQPPNSQPINTVTPNSHSGKQSLDLEATAGTDNTPLLPSTSNETLSVLPPYVSNGPNQAGPNKGSHSLRSTSGNRAQGVGLGVRMFDPAEDPLFSTVQVGQVDKEKDKELERAEGRDLTNTKLAKNQLVSSPVSASLVYASESQLTQAGITRRDRITQACH